MSLDLILDPRCIPTFFFTKCTHNDIILMNDLVNTGICMVSLYIFEILVSLISFFVNLDKYMDAEQELFKCIGLNCHIIIH